MARSATAAFALSVYACATQPTVRAEAPVAEWTEPDLAALTAIPLDETAWGTFPIPEAPRRPDLGAEIAAAATSLVGVKRLATVSREVPDDCTGLARLAYFAGGVDLMARGNRPGENGVSAIWRLAATSKATHFGTPSPGDLVFFVETYDRNRDGLRNDGRTHIGVVESVDAEGTVFFVHRTRQGVTRSWLNLAHRGRKWNPVLRPAEGELRAWDTAELFAGFAHPKELLAVAAVAPLPKGNTPRVFFTARSPSR
jgi:cell wall-associated NlpC family hydrolase